MAVLKLTKTFIDGVNGCYEARFVVRGYEFYIRNKGDGDCK